jgi:hypothetical protein
MKHNRKSVFLKVDETIGNGYTRENHETFKNRLSCVPV